MMSLGSHGCNFQTCKLYQETPEDVGPSRSPRSALLPSLSLSTVDPPQSPLWDDPDSQQIWMHRSPSRVPHFLFMTPCPVTGVPFPLLKGCSLGSREILFLLSICSIRIAENQSHLRCVTHLTGNSTNDGPARAQCVMSQVCGCVGGGETQAGEREGGNEGGNTQNSQSFFFFFFFRTVLGRKE